MSKSKKKRLTLFSFAINLLTAGPSINLIENSTGACENQNHGQNAL